MKLPSILVKVRRYLESTRGLRKSDIIFPAYPKSGSTWVRTLLLTALTRREGNNEVIDQKAVGDRMPAFGMPNFRAPWPYKTPRIIKTHNAFWFPFKGHRAILLVRDPRDVAVSHYHYINSRTYEPFKGTFQEFIRHPKYGLERWFKHYQSWQGHTSYMVRYEDLLADDVAEFGRLLEFLEIKLPPDVLEEAVDSCRFKKQKKLVEEKGHMNEERVKKGFNFMRSGKSNNWQEMFEPADLDLYEGLKKKYGVDIY